MKHIKIDIKQEILDLSPRLKYCFYKLYEESDISELIENTDTCSEIVNDEILTYKVREFYNPIGEKRTRYLIQENDNGIIENLVQIYKDDLERYTLERINKKKDGFINKGSRDENYRIKNITWWKRLFNKF